MHSTLLTVGAALAAVAAAAPKEVRDSRPYVGCFKRTSNAWPLEIYQGNFQKVKASPERCIADCAYNKPTPTLYGVSNFSCFCGYTTSDNTRLVADSFCSDKCNGDESSTCGGYGDDRAEYFSVYGDATAVPPASYIPGLKFGDCYYNEDNSGTLGGPSYKDDQGMTINACAEFCVGKHGLKGIFVGSDNTCYCSSGSQGLSKRAPSVDACYKRCPGDPKQHCGGKDFPYPGDFVSFWHF